MTQEQDQQTFEDAILRSWNEEEGGVAYVFFSSPTCQPCKTVKAKIEQLDSQGKLKIGFINVFHAVAAATRTQIRSVPTLVKFRAGTEVARLTGDQPVEKLREFFGLETA
jgi:thioredoxin-like negative regulator of GroEL